MIRRKTPLKRSQTPIKRSKAPRQQTGKQKTIKSQLSALKKSIELDAIQDGEYFCKGCGISHPGLDKSHILSVSQFPQFELLRDNIQLMCRKCHEIWESGEIKDQYALHCYLSNMAFLQRHDMTSYRKFQTRLLGYIREKNTVYGLHEKS